MKEYLVNQLLYVAIMMAIMIGIPTFCGPIFTVLFEIVVLLSTVYVCQRTLLLPIDLIMGKITKEVHFSGRLGIELLEFCRKKCCCEWKFYYEGRSDLILLVPVVVSEAELMSMKQPLVDQKVRVTYYRYSRILCNWESIGKG